MKTIKSVVLSVAIVAFSANTFAAYSQKEQTLIGQLRSGVEIAPVSKIGSDRTPGFQRVAEGGSDRTPGFQRVAEGGSDRTPGFQRVAEGGSDQLKAQAKRS
ncbi:hypothetical protein [Pseudomonas sp. P14-2025]|uniref:hypothetical protein n=1 Tax=Pseudomonas sp. P14-2025 TaxID=3421169 RepID=UPI003FA35474